MMHVADNRLDLVLAWDRQPIGFPPEIAAVAQRIGATAEVYGYGRERRVTPCAIETTSGEVLEMAMICIQPEAPVEDDMRFRLGTEIARAYESPFALPAVVRWVSSRAAEMRMGFSPTLIEMPDGRRFVMNGLTSFMLENGYDAREARLTGGDFFDEEPPPALIKKPKDVVYFIFDERRTWLQKLLRR